jgi:hypothetical protein
MVPAPVKIQRDFRHALQRRGQRGPHQKFFEWADLKGHLEKRQFYSIAEDRAMLIRG